MKNSAHTISRRAFIATCAATAALAAPKRAHAATRPPVMIFSKHLQFIRDWGELADTYVDLGCDAVDLTVRPRGHILPENAAKELPGCLKAIRDRGLGTPMVTTNLVDAKDPAARPTLEAAVAEGVPFFRTGSARYANKKPLQEELTDYEKDLRELAELGEELGITCCYHNHSGSNYVGAALWDLHQLITNIDSDNLGSNFDMGHAKVEGGYGAWKTNLRLLAPHVKAVAAKDFVWTDAERPQWVPLGSGRVPMVEMMTLFREYGFSGPVSIHFEYDMGSREETLAGMKAAVKTMNDILDEAGYA